MADVKLLGEVGKFGRGELSTAVRVDDLGEPVGLEHLPEDIDNVLGGEVLA